ncbi:D-tyrosyl-tRNA(Tyr) deacylase [Candidatus Woesearchaeota archaeon]|nr:D-tyrosyl-tRNA(Tyr) deacylase [Nanoarchaeota archaeon]MCB9370077.1 D-tyrosyl-tRNA(Tyr) deacylase [Candidatus Woesearchaeota archaeon]USN44608.1 MAG: D-tyrosyl-tRNA(Tyr) deacylase [Candidatus Woesearchaeota archaeon]
MKILVQRVDEASVSVEGEKISEIGKGLLLLVGFSKNYSEEKLEYLTKKILKLRLWPSEKKGFDLNISDIKGELLVVSQFTLHADCSDGNKPNFTKALEYEKAEQAYEHFIAKLKNSQLHVKTGKFGAKMKVKLINNGPVTIMLER